MQHRTPLLLASLLASISGCVVVQPAPPTTPSPAPVTRPTPPPPPAPACEPGGDVLYRETRRPLGNDAVPRETITIYTSGAFTGGKRGQGCLDGREVAALRATLTAARLAPRPQVTCRAMPHVEITVEIDEVGAVTWRAPCSRTPDAETMRGVELARDLVDGDRVALPTRCELGGPIVFRQASRPLHGDADGDTLVVYASGGWSFHGYEDRRGCLTAAELDDLRAHLTAMRLEPENRAVCAALPNSEVRVEAEDLGAITYEAPCSIGPDDETTRGITRAHELTVAR